LLQVLGFFVGHRDAGGNLASAEDHTPASVGSQTRLGYCRILPVPGWRCLARKAYHSAEGARAVAAGAGSTARRGRKQPCGLANRAAPTDEEVSVYHRQALGLGR